MASSLKSLFRLEIDSYIQRRLQNPPLQLDEYLEILLKQGWPTSVSMLRQLGGEEI